MTIFRLPLNTKILAGFTFAVGLLMVASVFIPVAGSFLFTKSTAALIDPTAVSQYPQPIVIGVLGIATPVDLYTPQEWFTETPDLPTSTISKVKYYSLSIPKLKIDHIPVEINGADLKQNAIQYPGSALPGTLGNAVIFGHSALPQFYNPANPETVFNHLPDIQLGDEIVINYDGVTYKYRVKETREVKPDQIEVMAQRYDRYEVTLITCVPLGTYWRRFVARAELVN